MYDFDRTLDHRTDGSLRWKQPAGRADVIGMGTADLDYFCPPAVQEAFRRIVEENTYNYRAKPDSYYQAVLGWYRRMYGLDLAPEMLSAVPGTICHIVLIPILVMALQRGGVVLNGAAVDAPVGTRRAVSPHGAV